MTRPIAFTPGDRVQFAAYNAAGARTNRRGTVAGEALGGMVRVTLADGATIALDPAALTLLPPAKTFAPGQGRPPSSVRLRLGDVLAVTEHTPDGVTPLRRYTVTAVEVDGANVRVTLAGDDGELVVVR
jgi:hypothetical protein